jgi:hypothetical protein
LTMLKVLIMPNKPAAPKRYPIPDIAKRRFDVKPEQALRLNSNQTWCQMTDNFFVYGA